MAPEKSNRAEDIFDEARSLPPSHRDEFLSQRCLNDASLRADVESLLAYDAIDSGLLDRPAARINAADLSALAQSASERDTPALTPPRNVGPFEIIEQIGSGGMGVVYRALQTHPVQREVALKLIQPGMNTHAVISRFQAERQALAMMDHPNVARIFDAGATADGRPWFAMELVPPATGQPITDFCDHHRLDTQQRLNLFIDVCHAIQHAHQKGVIHRDIKPSNILVQMIDERPLAKVIDFGIARATSARSGDRTLLTRQGDLIGTPQYMSPEQCRADAGNDHDDIDTRSDIYALGVVLYELLVGSPPLDPQTMRSASPLEIHRLILESDPPRPSARLSRLAASDSTRAGEQRGTEARSLARQLRGELDWIVMRAMAKDRDRRYASASELAADISRYLRHEPVLAGPPSAAYRMRTFVRRNRALVIGSAAVGLALVGGIIGTTWQAFAATRAREDAQRQAEIAKAVNDFLNDDLLSAADPRRPDREFTMRAALDSAARNIEQRFGDQPQVEAAIRSTIGVAYRNLGLYELAQPHLQRAHELAVRKYGEESDQAMQAAVELAWYEYRRGRPDLAEPVFARSLDVARKHHSAESEPVLQAMANLGMTQTALGKFEDANDLMSAALEVRLRTVGPDDLQTIYLRNNLSAMLVRQRRFEEAVPIVTAALESLRRTRPPNHPDFAYTLIELGTCHEQMGRLDRAEPLFEEAMTVARVSLGEQHHDYAAAVGAVARVRLMQRKPEEAAPLFAEALAIFRRTRGERDPEVLTLMHNLATTYVTLDRIDEAQPMFDETLAGRRAVLGEKHADTLATMYGLARLHGKRNEHAQADALFAAAIAGARESLSPNDPFLGVFLTGHGLCLTALTRYDEAEKALIESHDVLTKAFGPAHVRTTQCIDALVALYESSGRPDEAAVWRERKEAATQPAS